MYQCMSIYKDNYINQCTYVCVLLIVTYRVRKKREKGRGWGPNLTL